MSMRSCDQINWINLTTFLCPSQVWIWISNTTCHITFFVCVFNDLRWELIVRSVNINQGRIQDFKLGGGGAFKIMALSRARREHFWGISCEKITILRKKIVFFPILGGCAPGASPPLDLPLIMALLTITVSSFLSYLTLNVSTSTRDYTSHVTFVCLTQYTNDVTFLFFIH